MSNQNTNDACDINEILNEAENCRLGINGEIDIGRAIELFHSDELRKSEFSFVTVKMLEEFKEHFISESLFGAVRNMILFLMRCKKFAVSNSAYNMTIEIDDSIDAASLARKIDSVISSVINGINCKLFSGDKIAEKLNSDADRYNIIFFADVTQSIFDDIENIRKSYDSTPKTCKILFAKSDVIDRLREEYSSFYYQAIGHTQKNHPSANSNGYMDIYIAFMREMSFKHKIDPGFSAAIKEYIDAVYPTADLQNKEFVDDLIKRVEQQMLTVPYLSTDGNNFTVTEEGVPYSRKIEEKRAGEAEIEEDAEKKDDIPVATFEELTIPHEMNITAAENAPKNILLLSLSTFGSMKENKFKLKKKDEENSEKEYSGIYQLDPIPKMLSDILGEKGQYLDEIIMLETEKTYTKPEPGKPMREILVNGNARKLDCSPEQFFKCQVKNYLRPLPEGSSDDIDNDERFVPIRIEDVNNPSEEIKKTVEHIREQYKLNDNNVNLYIDAHGSLRGLSLATLAINSLLLNEGKGAKKVYSIELGENSIFEDSADSLFKFVSGLNEFRSFGRIDSLESYMEGQVSGLMGPMKEVAEAVSVCNIKEFERAKEEIKAFYNTEATTNTDKENYLSIFSNVIKEDYKNLLKENSTVIDEIEWCFNKRLYQAALTIIESKVPEYIFGTEDEDADLPLILFENDTQKNEAKTSWENDDNHGKRKNILFGTWLLNNYYFRERNNTNRWIINNDPISDHYADQLNNHSQAVNFHVKNVNDCIISISINSRLDNAYTKRFILLLKMLKATRNTINHCEDNIPPINVIHNAIKDFLEMFRNIEDRLLDKVFTVTEVKPNGKVYGHIENESETVKLAGTPAHNNRIAVGDIFTVRFNSFDQQINKKIYDIVQST